MKCEAFPVTPGHLCVLRSGRKTASRGAMTGADDLSGGSPAGPHPVWNGTHSNLSAPVLPARPCPGHAERVWVFGHCSASMRERGQDPAGALTPASLSGPMQEG